VVYLPAYPSEKYEFVNWDDDMPFSEWKVIKIHGSKPPTSEKYGI
jgi:hypothetical protein